MPRKSARKPATAPRKRPRQARARVTVDALVEAVERILAREGLEALTAARVAEVAGVSVGSLYQYFPGKEAIFAALVERYMAQFFDTFAGALQASLEAPLAAVVEGMVRALVGVYRVQARIQPILYDAMPALGLTPQMIALLDRYTAEVARFLAARRDLALADAEATAWVLVHAMEGLVRRYGIAGPSAADEPRYFAEVVRLLLAFVAGRPEAGVKNLAWIVAGAILGPLVFVLGAWVSHAIAQPKMIDAQATRTTEIWDGRTDPHSPFVAGPPLVEDVADVEPILLSDGSLLIVQPHAPTAQRLLPGAAAFVAIAPQPEPRLDRPRAFATSAGALIVGAGFVDSKLVPIARSYDRASGGWSDVPLLVDEVISCAGAATPDRALVITHSWVDSKLHSVARLFDVRTRTWSTIDRAPHDTHDCLVASDGAGRVTVLARVTFGEDDSGVAAMPLHVIDGARDAKPSWQPAKRLEGEEPSFATTAQYFADGWFVMRDYVLSAPHEAWRFHPRDFRRAPFEAQPPTPYARAIAIDSTHLLFTGGQKLTGDERRDLWNPVRVADATLVTYPDKVSPLPPMHATRNNHFVALLGDGRVLVGGGLTNANIPHVANILDTIAALAAPLGLVAVLILAWRRFRPAWWAIVLGVAAGALIDVAIFTYAAASAIKG